MESPEKEKIPTLATFTWRRYKRGYFGMIGLAMLSIEIVVSIFAPWIARYDWTDMSAFERGDARHPPNLQYLLGTDKFGRDIFSVIVYGTRYTLIIGLGAVAIASVIGVSIGTLSGYFGGRVDDMLSSVINAFLTLPFFLIVIVLMKEYRVLTANLTTDVGQLNLVMTTVLIGSFQWASIAKVTRTEVLRIKEQTFVEAARCLGRRDRIIMFKHILPNAVPAIFVVVTLTMATAILMESSITFLGFGDPTVPTWGTVLSFQVQFMKTDWWGTLFPGLAIFWTCVGLALIGEGLNRALNPRLER